MSFHPFGTDEEKTRDDETARIVGSLFAALIFPSMLNGYDEGRLTLPEAIDQIDVIIGAFEAVDEDSGARFRAVWHDLCQALDNDDRDKATEAIQSFRSLMRTYESASA